MWGIDPQSFYKMTLREWWLIHDAKNTVRNMRIEAAGGLTNANKKELYDTLKAAREND